MIEFSSKNEAQKALSALNKKKIYNSKLILKFSRYHDQIYEFLECFDEPSKNQVFWQATNVLRKYHLNDQQ